MKDNFDLVLQQMRTLIVSVKRSAPDIQADTRIEMADDQDTVCTGVIYLAEAGQAADWLAGAYVQPASYLLVANVTEAGQVARLPACHDMTVVEFSCPLSTLYNRLTKAIAKRFEKHAVVTPGADAQQQDRLLQLWRQIRSRTMQGTVEIQQQLRQLCPNYQPYVRLIVVVPDEQAKREDWTAPLQQLRAAMPGCCLFLNKDMVDEEIVGFQFFDRQTFGVIENEANITAALKQNKLRMMVSNSTRDYGKLNTLYSLTRRTGLGAERLNLQRGERIYHYERYGMYQIIDLCTQRYMSLFSHSDIMYLVHPIVVHLTRYDESHRTNLRDVLFYYLQNSQDLKRTAETLYMHRNTVANKINQIRSICSIDFEDGGLCQRLLFSCQVILYYERVLQQRLSRNEEPRNS